MSMNTITPGALCAPGDNFSNYILQEPLIADDSKGKFILFLLLGESGFQVYNQFTSLMESFPAGFSQENQHVLWINENTDKDLEENVRVHTLSIHDGEIPQRRFQTMVGNFFRTVRTAGQNIPACIVLVGSLTDPLVKYLPEICLNLRLVGDRFPIDRDLFLHLPANDYSVVSPRQQYALLREIFFMSKAATRPLPDNSWDQDKWLDHLYLFENNSAEEDAELFRRMAHTLFIYLNPDFSILPSRNQITSEDSIQLLQANYIGLPLPQLIEYFSCHIARQLLFDVGGVLNVETISQADVDSLWNEVDRSSSSKAFKAGRFTEGLTLVEKTINNHLDIDRWKKITILQLAMKWLPTNLEKFVKKSNSLQQKLRTLQNLSLKHLQETTTDPVFRWNVSTQQAETVASHLLDNVLSVYTEQLLQQLRANVGVHLEFQAENNELQFLLVCIPAKIEGEFYLHDHVFPLLTSGDEDRFVYSLIALINTTLKSLLRDHDWTVSLSPIRQEDRNFLQESTHLTSRLVTNNLPLEGLLISPRNVSLEPAMIFPGLSEARRLESGQQPFTAALCMLFNYPAARVVRVNELKGRYVPQIENQYGQLQLKNAAYFESQYYHLTRSHDWIIEGSLLETLFDRRAVILFFLALDRQQISWSLENGWRMESQENYDSIILTAKTDNYSVRPEKDLESLFAAYYNFTLGIPSTLEPGTFQHPLNPINRTSYFTFLQQKFSTDIPATKRLSQFRWVESQIKAYNDSKFSGFHHLYLVSRNILNF